MHARPRGARLSVCLDAAHILILFAVKRSKRRKRRFNYSLRYGVKVLQSALFIVGILAPPNYYEHGKSIFENAFISKNRIEL